MGKFNSPHDEYLWEGSVVSGVVTGDGESDGPLGWFAAVTLRPGDSAEEAAAAAHYGTIFLILHEGNEGFVTVLPFDTEFARDRRIVELQQALALIDAGISDVEIVQAITGYRRALAWDAGHDDKGLSWTDEAQRRTADEVTDFMTENATDVHTYMQVVGVGWEQVGADFAFSRLESEASRQGGFEKNAYGETVDDLLAAARRYPKVAVNITTKNEMEVLDA